MSVFGHNSDLRTLMSIFSSNNLVAYVLIFTDGINDSETAITASTNDMSFHHDQSCHADPFRHPPVKSFRLRLDLWLNLWLGLLYVGMLANWNLDCFLADLVKFLFVSDLKRLRTDRSFINFDSLLIFITTLRALMLTLMLIVSSVVLLLSLLILWGLIFKVGLIFVCTSG
jgi:hypothetical protein